MPVNLGLDDEVNELRDVTDNSTSLTDKIYALYNGLARSTLNPFGSAALKDTGTAAGEIPVIDSNGKLPSSVLPTTTRSFTDLDDTPSSLSGHARKLVTVNASETALAFGSDGSVPVVIVSSTAGWTIGQNWSAFTAQSDDADSWTYLHFIYRFDETSSKFFYRQTTLLASAVMNTASSEAAFTSTTISRHYLGTQDIAVGRLQIQTGGGLAVQNGKIYLATHHATKRGKLYAILGSNSL